MRQRIIFIIIILILLLLFVLAEIVIAIRFTGWPQVCNQELNPLTGDGMLKWCFCFGIRLSSRYNNLAVSSTPRDYCLGVILAEDRAAISSFPSPKPKTSPSPSPIPTPTPTLMPTPSPNEMAFKTISHGQYSGFSEAKNYAITNTNDWQSLWNKVYGNVLSKPPLPEVDFNKSMVIAVSLGSKPTGGYDIKITGVKEREAEGLIAISVEESSPGKDCIVSQALTSPYHIIETEKTDKEVVFDTQKVVLDCSG